MTDMTSQDTPRNDASRDRLIEAILEFLAGQDVLTPGDARAALEGEIEAAGPGAVASLKSRLEADNGWAYYPHDPLARRIHHRLAGRFLSPGSGLVGAEHLPQVSGVPVTIFANHLSYADANVVEVLLRRSGCEELANRLTAIAGPKVFTSRVRRFSSLCFGTIKVPQSTEVSSGEAVLDVREVARAARRAIGVAHDRLRAGDALLLFGEGTRSRTASMQPMLTGVARYLDVPGTWVLPAGLAGPEQLFSVEDSRLRPARLAMQVGPPMRAEDLRAASAGDRRVMLDAIGLAVAELLPPSYRGVYGNHDEFPAARDVLNELRVAG